MSPTQIAFIVPAGGSKHAIYLKDGRIVTIDSKDGLVEYVSRLPTAEAIAELEKAAE